MIKRLPIFPLKMVVFPDEKINLHVFEPRYRQLINECEEKGIAFLIPFFYQKRIMPVVTEVKLHEIIKKYEDGRLDVSVKATNIIYGVKEIHHELPDRLYAAADVESMPYVYDNRDALLCIQIQEKLIQLYEILNIEKTVPSDAQDIWTFDYGHHVGFSQDQEFKLLTTKDEKARQEMILDHLINLIPIVLEMEELKRKAKLNGHIRHIIPPKF